jgi:hypothetical protein
MSKEPGTNEARLRAQREAIAKAKSFAASPLQAPSTSRLEFELRAEVRETIQKLREANAEIARLTERLKAAEMFQPVAPPPKPRPDLRLRGDGPDYADRTPDSVTNCPYCQDYVGHCPYCHRDLPGPVTNSDPVTNSVTKRPRGRPRKEQPSGSTMRMRKKRGQT